MKGRKQMTQPPKIAFAGCRKTQFIKKVLDVSLHLKQDFFHSLGSNKTLLGVLA